MNFASSVPYTTLKPSAAEFTHSAEKSNAVSSGNQYRTGVGVTDAGSRPSICRNTSGSLGDNDTDAGYFAIRIDD